MYPLLIHCSLSLLFLIHFADCAPYEQRKPGINPQIINNSKEHDATSSVNNWKMSDIVVHGILLWASMGFLMPVGILTMRMSSTRDCHHSSHKILFHLHATFQALSVLLVTIEAVLSIRNFENKFNNTHQRIGLALYAATYLQILIGFRRPKRGTRGRSWWYFIHWILGTTISMVGILNIYTGLQAYHKRTSRSTMLWTIIFTAQVSFMTVFYLFQDKWEYMQKQTVVPSAGGAPEISAVADQLDNQKITVDEPSRKSNALGTYFSRSNALHKLFQLA